MVGAVLYATADPIRSADSLFNILSTDLDSSAIRASGFNESLVNALRSNLPRDKRELQLACARGAGWVLGRRSSPKAAAWELVASVPTDAPLPPGVRRTTGETIVGLINGAELRLCFAAPYVDPGGVATIMDAVVAATSRGVMVEIFDPPNWAPAGAALHGLQTHIRSSGDPRHLLIRRAAPDAPWAHLKVVVADDRVAYLGSANITEAGLMRNLELGVLITGDDVAAIKRLLDQWSH